ncbi:hypothetical protein FRC00_012699, partial [Tulasnella sp. 408]
MSKVPLSIESLLQKQKEEREAAAKPKFLTKEERAKLAIEKRTQEIREQKARDEEKRREREALEREAGQLRQREQERYGGGSGAGRHGGGRCIIEEDEVAETTIGTGIDHLQMRRLAPVPNKGAAFQPDLELNAPKITRL